jgi:WD40 repeat protein
LISEKEDNISKFYNLIDATPKRQYWEHEYDIVDLSWQKRRDERGQILKSIFIVTCSLDCKAILWRIDKEAPEQIYDHGDALTCVSFHPVLENIFVTGSLDQSIRIWSMDQSDSCLDEV